METFKPLQEIAKDWEVGDACDALNAIRNIITNFCCGVWIFQDLEIGGFNVSVPFFIFQYKILTTSNLFNY